MRNLIAALLAWLLPANCQRRAHTVAHVPTQRPETPRTARRPLDIIDGESTPLVRPYLVQWERQRELHTQRERRIALVLATAGIDYEGLTA
jgi:hypothetical protein